MDTQKPGPSRNKVPNDYHPERPETLEDTVSINSTDITVSVDRFPNPPPFPKIFIERDYNGSLAVQFETEVPACLNPYIEETQFRDVIDEINALFIDAEKCGIRSFFETVITVLSFNLVSLFFKTKYEKCLDQVNKLIRKKNKELFGPRHLKMISPSYHGLRVIEIEFTDYEFRGNS